MPAADYQFFTEWWVDGTVEEVSDILSEAESLPRWWPSVYLDVKVLDPGDARGVGKRVLLFTKGWLPYTLRWEFRTTESRAPHGFTLEASGDFVGRGIWSFEQRGPRARITYDWRIRATKPLIRKLSFLMKPIFAANHRWAMARGEESLRLELRRCRAKSIEERLRIPPAPRPVLVFRRRG
jgi:hypothetical protein